MVDSDEDIIVTIAPPLRILLFLTFIANSLQERYQMIGGVQVFLFLTIAYAFRYICGCYWVALQRFS